jgi:ABC-type Fe3+/spermidine/putrescine transport system ATPase subunit
MAGTEFLRLDAITKRYGALVAVDDISLSIKRGEFFSLLGPSGCGKTTLLRMIGGFIQPDRGAVVIDGQDVTELPPNKRPTNMVFQSYAIFPHLNVRDNIAYGLRTERVPKAELDARVAQALAMIKLEHCAEKQSNELSGGQRQRVLIARAVAQEAQVLLVDEPTSSLDPEHQIRVFELLARLTREGRGAIVVTHELNLASQFASRLVLLDRGRVVASGDAEAVLRPEVLVPVYGPHLHFGRIDPRRPFVVPWREPTESPEG